MAASSTSVAAPGVLAARRALPAVTSEGYIRRNRVRGGGHEIVYPHRAASVPLARRAILDDVADSIGDTETCHAVAIVVSELMGNAVRHAGPVSDGGVVLRWQVRADVVDLEVTDGGSCSLVRPVRLSEAAPGGRGLRIVRHLADEWGVQEDPSSGQRTVWAAVGGPSRRRRPLS